MVVKVGIANMSWTGNILPNWIAGNPNAKLAGLTDEQLKQVAANTGLAFPMLKAQQRAEIASAGATGGYGGAEEVVPTVEVQLVQNPDNPKKARKKNIKKLRKALKTYLENQSTLPMSINPKQSSISGWGVILKNGGYQKRHIHPEAKISGVFYLSVPNQTSSSKTDEGNLLFSTKSPLSVSPNTGLVVLFPSYLPHETVPQCCKTTERICIAFNFN